MLGRFAVDFVVVRGRRRRLVAVRDRDQPAQGRHHAPVPHPAVPHRRRYDAESGRFLTPDGDEKHLVATDHLEADELRALSVGDLFDVVARHGLHFDQSRQAGIVFHMISSITELGRVGMTAVGDTPDHAMELYRRAETILLEEAAAARRERTLPN